MAKFVKGRWCALGESTRGASHIASGLQNQDAISFVSLPKGTGIIAAIADGHGGAKYIRSDVGAKLAVSVATEQLQQLLTLPPKRLLGFHPAELEEFLAPRIVRSWIQRVSDHIAAEPFSLNQVSSAPNGTSDAVVAYGSTLIAAAVTESVALVLQLGDGDVLWVTPSGEVTRPLPRDPRLLGNETSSLCSPDAAQSMRVRLKSLAADVADRPNFIMLSTDGYANCFKDDVAFTQTASDYAEFLKQRNGTVTVRQNIGGWLRQASDDFSRDDITLALLYSMVATTHAKRHTATTGK